MSTMQYWLEALLTTLLAVTLFHAFRLERALGVLRRDRASLEELITGFNISTREAETGIERLQAAADGAGRQISRHVDQAKGLKNDLVFLTERGEKLADQLEGLVRQGRPLQESGVTPEDSRPKSRPKLHAVPNPGEETDGRVRSQAEKELLRALRMAR